MTASGLLGFLSAHYLLALPLAPALITATALTATSISVAVPVWEQAGRLGTDDGALTVDVAELDDVSGILAMALLFAVIPVLESGNGAFWGTLAGAASALHMGVALAVAAVAGKVIGAILSALLATPAAGALAIGVSMVPRAEIAMVIMDQAHDLGAWAVDDTLYGAMTVVTLITCSATPPVLAALLRRQPG